MDSIVSPFSKLVMVFPMASPSAIGTALPICLYWLWILPQMTQSSGKPCMRLYSSTDKGLSSIGWHRSVAGIVGVVTRVGDGLSNDNLL